MLIQMTIESVATTTATRIILKLFFGIEIKIPAPRLRQGQALSLKKPQRQGRGESVVSGRWLSVVSKNIWPITEH